MGSDLTVANAARVSFNKHKDTLDKGDEKLIGYLASHGHWTPFSHPMVTLRMKTPIFVARQLFKHKVGMTENEVSRRYVDDAPDFYWPDVWRARADNKKQGSSDEAVDLTGCVLPIGNTYLGVWDVIDNCQKMYEKLIAMGVAPEQARMVLPQSMFTEWYWTGSLSSFARIYKLRADPHAQMETQEVAKMIDAVIAPLFPVSWKVLCDQ